MFPLKNKVQYTTGYLTAWHNISDNESPIFYIFIVIEIENLFNKMVILFDSFWTFLSIWRQKRLE